MKRSDVQEGHTILRSPALVLCRTPFQGRLLQDILADDMVYDLVYVTGHDTLEDRNYSDRLARRARRSAYLVLNPALCTFPAALGLLARIPPWVFTDCYKTLLLASLDNPVFRKIARKQGKAQVATFDDGAESIVTDPFLMSGGEPWRDALYGRILGGGTLSSFRDRIGRHYTVFGSLQNVVPPERAVRLELHWLKPTIRSADVVTFFIGQPFREVYSPEQIERIRGFLNSRHIDFYVQHPREPAPLLPEIPLLTKNGLIAEDAILEAAAGRQVVVIAGFSTVLFTLKASFIRKLFLSVPEGKDADDRQRLASIASCEVVDV